MTIDTGIFAKSFRQNRNRLIIFHNLHPVVGEDVSPIRTSITGAAAHVKQTMNAKLKQNNIIAYLIRS